MLALTFIFFFILSAGTTFINFYFTLREKTVDMKKYQLFSLISKQQKKREKKR